MPPEKKKKGKRKSDAVLEMVESDDTASLCTLATGGEESTDPMDNTVSSPEPIYIRPPGFSCAEYLCIMQFICTNTKYLRSCSKF